MTGTASGGRARIAAAIAVVGAALVVSACGGSDSDDEKATKATSDEPSGPLTYTSWGGAYTDAIKSAWLEPYQEEFPDVKITYDEPSDYAKLVSMVESGNVTWDLVAVGQDFGLRSDEQYLEKIDCEVVPCDELQPDKFPTTGYRVPSEAGSVILGYNTEKIGGGAPESWADFFDLEKFEGKRVMTAGTTSFILEIALVADGVGADELYPLDLDRAFAKLDSIRDSLILTDSLQECAELVASGDATMGSCWAGRFQDVAGRGSPVEVTWNENMQTGGYLVIPKGAPNAEGAQQLIAYMTSAENNGAFSNFFSAAPANEMAEAADKNKDWLSSTYGDQAVFSDDEWWDENRKDVEGRYQEWSQGG
jgi:putative spermidine/putrescine transport system substrate-binding protein